MIVFFSRAIFFVFGSEDRSLRASIIRPLGRKGEHLSAAHIKARIYEYYAAPLAQFIFKIDFALLARIRRFVRRLARRDGNVACRTDRVKAYTCSAFRNSKRNYRKYNLIKSSHVCIPCIRIGLVFWPGHVE